MKSLNESNGRRADTIATHKRAVERVTVVMRDRLYEGLTLGEMADVAIMSPYHFNRVFRQVTGITPSHFLCGLRIEAAKRRLLNSSLSVTEICFDVGYNSLGTFTRRFKELVNLPPRDFRALGSAAVHRPLDRLRRHALPHRPTSGGRGITGEVWAPEDLRGPIFLGLFAKPIPEGRPISCAVLAEAGPYRLRPVAPGRYYLFAVGLRWSATPESSLILEDAYRAGVLGEPIEVEENGWAGNTELTMRPPEPIDPPIPMALAFLLGEELARRTPFAARPPMAPPESPRATAPS